MEPMLKLWCDNQVHQPKPYEFGYSIKDQHGEHHRHESGNGVGMVIGNYGFTDDRGITRQVNYIADRDGFRAQIKTNEPGTSNQSPAAVQVISDAPYANVAAAPYADQSHVSQPVLPQVSQSALPQISQSELPQVSQLAAPLVSKPARYRYDLSSRGYREGRNENLGYRGYDFGYNENVNALGYSGHPEHNVAILNSETPLIGGFVRRYDSRFGNLA
ncbi:cuticle protein 16.8 [Trichonephila inaurata madagascariensis]|uniref:Cuticle protein 16.8 n=1 Tax=Trichonephila inaurata madagascariensis TaxID=2747483 RepID=A0A8X6YUJ1_9ARAC|nr:cuticle protein 16.8 [Trichonephila inaurata madagascariensis]